MSKYAFYFGEENQNGENRREKRIGHVAEYFVPYNPNLLIKLVDNEELKKRLRYSIKNKLTFDQFVERNELQEVPFIKEIPLRYRNSEDSIYNDKIRENNSEINDSESIDVEWLNDENDIDELVAWDYIADAYVVSAMVEGYENIGQQQLARYTLESRLQYKYVRIILSIIVYTDMPDDYFGPDFDEPNVPQDGTDNFDESRNSSYKYNARYFSEKLNDFYHEFENKNVTEWGKPCKELLEFLDVYWSKEDHEHFLQILNVKVSVQQIIELLNYIKDIPDNEREYKKCTSQIKKLGKAVQKELQLCIDERKRSTYLLSEMEGYDLYYEELTYGIHRGTDVIELLENITYDNVYNCFGKQNSVNSGLSGAAGRYEAIKSIRDFFKKSKPLMLNEKVRKKLWKKYTPTGQGCFAILEAENGNFFSLSGVYEIDPDVNKQNQLSALAEYIKSNILPNPSSYTFIKMDENTMRYTNIVKPGLTKVSTTEYITKCETYGDDIAKKVIVPPLDKSTVNIIGLTFGCCERKLLGSTQFNNKDVKKVYSRWAPCWKCQPAVYNLIPNVLFFAFDIDFASWKANGKPEDVKKYKVVNAGYSVIEI